MFYIYMHVWTVWVHFVVLSFGVINKLVVIVIDDNVSTTTMMMIMMMTTTIIIIIIIIFIIIQHTLLWFLKFEKN